MASSYFVVKPAFMLACSYLVGKEKTVYLAHGADAGLFRALNGKECQALLIALLICKESSTWFHAGMYFPSLN
jgi:hypothetical protein